MTSIHQIKSQFIVELQTEGWIIAA